MSQRPNLHLLTGRCRSPGTCAAARPCNEGAGATLTKHRQATKASQWHLWSVHYPPKWYPFIDQLRMNSWVGWCHVWPRWDSNSRPRCNGLQTLQTSALDHSATRALLVSSVKANYLRSTIYFKFLTIILEGQDGSFPSDAPGPTFWQFITQFWTYVTFLKVQTAILLSRPAENYRKNEFKKFNFFRSFFEKCQKNFYKIIFFFAFQTCHGWRRSLKKKFLKSVKKWQIVDRSRWAIFDNLFYF